MNITTTTTLIINNNLNDGEYSYNVHPGAHCIITINKGDIRLKYSYITYGVKNIFDLGGIILSIMSDNMIKVQFENNCIYDFIFLENPTSSDINSGYGDIPYLPTHVHWNRTIDLILIHSKVCNNQSNDCNIKDKILNTMQFEKKEKNVNKVSFDNLPLGGEEFTFMMIYKNNCLYSKKMEFYILKKILNNEQISKIYIDGEYNISDIKPLDPSNIQDIFIEQSEQPMFGYNKNGYDIQSTSLVTYDKDMEISLKKMKQTYKFIKANRLCELKNKDYSEDNKANMDDENINIYHSKFRENNDLTILTFEKCDWKHDISDVISEYICDSDIVFPIEIYFSIPKETYFVDTMYIVKRKGLSTIYTSFDEVSCIETFEQFNKIDK